MKKKIRIRPRTPSMALREYLEASDAGVSSVHLFVVPPPSVPLPSSFSPSFLPVQGGIG